MSDLLKVRVGGSDYLVKGPVANYAMVDDEGYLIVDESGNFVKPVVITEGKHKFGSGGLDLDGDIFVKLNSSSAVVQL